MEIKRIFPGLGIRFSPSGIWGKKLGGNCRLGFQEQIEIHMFEVKF